MIRTLALVAAFISAPVWAAETVVVDLSQNRVAITANFSGSEIFVFGAVKRDGPVDENLAPLDVAIVVEGPLVHTTVRKKEKVFGIWLNTDSVQVNAAPSFFTVATTGPLEDILNEGELRDYSIGVNYAVRPQSHADENVDFEAFSEAVARIRLENGLYSEREGIVHLTAETLFNTSIQLPANLVEGDYTARIYLIRDRSIVADTAVEITVRKEGLERWLYNLAHEQALIYALLSLAVALLAGYGASAFFRLLKR